MGTILTTAIIKGGTSKTTTAAAMAQAAAAKGMKVLAIDTDPQANLSFALGADINKGGTVQLLHGADLKDVIQSTAQNIDVIAGHRDLSTEKTTPGSARRLKEALHPIGDNYDIIIIDTPPTLGELVYNALNAAGGLVIPLETDTSSLQGFYQITEIANQFPDLKILGVVLTRYDGRSKLNRYLKDVITDAATAAGIPVLGCIHNSIAVREAQAMQRSLFEYAPKCRAAADYLDLFETLNTEKVK